LIESSSVTGYENGEMPGKTLHLCGSSTINNEESISTGNLTVKAHVFSPRRGATLCLAGDVHLQFTAFAAMLVR
jgi:hypothetical protein